MTGEEAAFLLSHEAECAALCGRAKTGAKVHFFYQNKTPFGAITSGTVINAYFESNATVGSVKKGAGSEGKAGGGEGESTVSNNGAIKKDDAGKSVVSNGEATKEGDGGEGKAGGAGATKITSNAIYKNATEGKKATKEGESTVSNEGTTKKDDAGKSAAGNGEATKEGDGGKNTWGDKSTTKEGNSGENKKSDNSAIKIGFVDTTKKEGSKLVTGFADAIKKDSDNNCKVASGKKLASGNKLATVDNVITAEKVPSGYEVLVKSDALIRDIAEVLRGAGARCVSAEAGSAKVVEHALRLLGREPFFKNEYYLLAMKGALQKTFFPNENLKLTITGALGAGASGVEKGAQSDGGRRVVFGAGGSGAGKAFQTNGKGHAALGLGASAVDEVTFASLSKLHKLYMAEEVDCPGVATSAAGATLLMKKALDSQIVAFLKKEGQVIAKAQTNALGYNFAQLGGVYTATAFRGAHYASIVLCALIGALRARSLTPVLFVKKSNAKAIALYHGLGFSSIGEYEVLYY